MEHDISQAHRKCANEFVSNDGDHDGTENVNDGDCKVEGSMDADLIRKGVLAKETGKIRLGSVLEMKALLLPNDGPPLMLRRDKNSKDSDGNSIIDLPMLVNVNMEAKKSCIEHNAMEKMIQYTSNRYVASE